MNIEQQLLRDEGEVLHAYQDHLGFWTLGIGRLIDKRKGGGITHDEAVYLLKNDIATRTAQLKSRLPWVTRLDDARLGVLLNMAFQLGIAGLMNFKRTLSLVQDGRYESAATEMLNSGWAQQTPERARRLSKQMRTGTWQ